MAFLTKRKKFKFLVRLTVVNLSAVPFVNGILFCKIRLLQGGGFSELTTRFPCPGEEVQENCVQWQKESCFTCKMNASPVTGVLDPSICRVSVRKELKGGKSFVKLGFVDLNLAEFAGAGSTARCCLLEGYDTKNTRQDNSILKVSISMQLLSGDPCFKTPHSMAKPIEVLGCQSSLALDCKGDDGTGSSVPETEPIRPDSCKLKRVRSLLGTGIPESSDRPPEQVIRKRHSRNSSASSQLSKVSGYSSEGSVCTPRFELAHRREGSGSSALSSGTGSMADVGDGALEGAAPLHRIAFRSERLSRRKNEEPESRPTQVDDTRVNADDIVEQILRDQDFSQCGSAEDSGLQLYVGRDGTVRLGSLQTDNRWYDYKPVVIDSH
ncbi:protein FAM102A-like isoform X2 [Pristis pectinata]|uniref:protein FAM102A-like isoform X2 n=1 Tax=Pristis pectinata TaxID=685728 RepID=UPI00223D62A1|nr:protein FAM102A-like isoform X2 [Pristis pectinata]